MPTTRRFRWVTSVLIALTFILLGSAVRAEEHRFVHPEDTTTYIEPASKSELRVVIDQHLGGTKDVTVADLVIPPGVDVPDHVHQSTEIFYVLSGELEQTSEGKVQKLTA
ncbi:MAG TPA: cupin domain-containing protein, partial [Candidatus Binatia bacterium]|nr:cupin domain-containing protein [Candidatus Binatia bacterium]